MTTVTQSFTSKILHVYVDTDGAISACVTWDDGRSDPRSLAQRSTTLRFAGGEVTVGGKRIGECSPQYAELARQLLELVSTGIDELARAGLILP